MPTLAVPPVLRSVLRGGAAAVLLEWLTQSVPAVVLRTTRRIATADDAGRQA